jgi:ABC-2 type transport system ATP-binding protein
MSPILEAHDLHKRFGKGAKAVDALDGLDLVAESGQVLAVLGPNGAGKTTFVRSIATLLRPDSGVLRVAGIDAFAQPAAVRRVIGLAGQYAAVEEAMTGRENVEMIARLFGQSAADARANSATVLEVMGLADAADRLVRTYSGGMRRKLDLGASLVGAPRLLLLDEPTTGLDPRSRIELWDAIRGLVEAGTDVVLTTQYLDEADQLASQVAIVDKGRVIASGTPGELKARAGADVVAIHARRPEDLDQLTSLLSGLGPEPPRVDFATRSLTVPVEHGSASLAQAVRALDDAGLVVDDVGLRRPTLDEVFLTLTGAPIDSGEDAEAPPAKSRRDTHTQPHDATSRSLQEDPR